MTAVGLGQQGSQAVGSGFESLLCQISLRFIPNIFAFSIPEISERLKDSPMEFFGTETKNFDGKSRYPPPRLLSINFFLFRYRKFSETQHRRVPL